MFAISRLLRVRERWRRYKVEVIICGDPTTKEIVDEYTFEIVAKFVAIFLLEGAGTSTNDSSTFSLLWDAMRR